MSDLPLLSGDLLPGATVGSYVVEGVVGRGGMGTVYRARDPRLDRVVALKLVAAAVAQDAEFRERFLREARSAAAIEHPHIVPVHEVGEHHGQPFLAMRYVDGPDLREVLAVSGPLEPSRVGSIALQLSSALDVAHAKGLVHRDIKPANIMLPLDDVHDAGHVYLTDFGVARKSAATTMTDGGDLVGTLAYVAPEVIAGQPATRASDLYALACTLFHLLCGRPPFTSDHDAGLLWAHMNQDPPAATSLVPELPEQVDEAFVQALAKAPEDRHGTCTAFAERLAEALEGLGAGPVAVLEGPEGVTRVVRGGAGSLATVVQRLPGGEAAAEAARPQPDLRRGRRALLVGAAVVAGLGAGVAAGLVAASGDEPEVPTTATLRVPSSVAQVALPGWRRVDAGSGELRGLGLSARWSAETQLDGERVVATVGKLASAGGARDPLPRAASNALLGRGNVRFLELGGATAVEVSGPLVGDDVTNVAVVVRATDKRLIAVSCRSEDENAVVAGCRELAAALRPAGGARWVSFGADPAAARQLSAALRRAAGRRADRRALAGDSAAARSGAAERLASRRRTAARAVRRISVSGPAAGAFDRLAAALDTSARALRSAARGDEAARGRLVRAERALRAARRALAQHGYE